MNLEIFLLFKLCLTQFDNIHFWCRRLGTCNGQHRLQADAVDDRVVALDRIIDHGFVVVLIDGHQTSSEVPSTASCRLSHPGIC